MKKNENYRIIFEDDYILGIAKPSGVLTIPDRYDSSKLNLASMLKKQYGKVFVVHRLDRDTSGVLLFAKDAESHRKLNTMFQTNSVKKLYHAALTGIVNKDDFDIDIPIAPDPARKGCSKPTARGKESMSRLHVIERFRAATLVEIDLVTGRHHQLRTHVAAIGHPLLVDPDYGSNSEFFLSSIKRKFNIKKNDSEKPIISRITMHAYSITFAHPATDAETTITEPYPKDFKALLEVLRKYSEL